MNDLAQFDASNPLLSASMKMLPSAFFQITAVMVILAVLSAVIKQTTLVYILIFMYLVLATSCILWKQLRWVFFTGKLSKDIMADGTGGSKHNPLIQEGEIITRGEFLKENQKLPKPRRRKPI